jgi:transcription antitermination factor NusG
MSNGKRWYAVYTRPRWEKKVSELIGKKNVETYCPLNRVVRQWSDRKKLIFEPLFTSYVFVQCTEKEHVLIRQTPGVINLVYWLKKPAIIRDVEIEMIQRFLNEHQNVKLEKAAVNVNDIVRIVSGALMDEEGQVFEVRNKTVKVVLPSLGYAMTAELELASVRVIYPEPRDYQKVGYLQ